MKLILALVLSDLIICLIQVSTEYRKIRYIYGYDYRQTKQVNWR